MEITITFKNKNNKVFKISYDNYRDARNILIRIAKTPTTPALLPLEMSVIMGDNSFANEDMFYWFGKARDNAIKNKE